MPAVGAAIAALGASLGGAISAVSAFAAGSFVGSLLVNTAVSLGLSLIARALAPKPTIRQSGIQTAVTTTGGIEPQGFILGRTATAGHHVAPPMSHDDGGTPNGFLTYVIELSDLPGIALSRVIVDDGYSDLGADLHPDYGAPLLAQRREGVDHAWIRFYDGTQTAADPTLVARYASYPDRPWSSAHVGQGTSYAILTFRHDRAVFNALPAVRFEIDGIPLYDPRFDASVGGAGTQSWADPSSWARSANPAVMIYNILRGITLPTGEIWGGDVPAEDLPTGNWFAAMNACDAPIGGRPSFVAGLEVRLGMEPAEVIEELAKSCLGQISEMGGVFRMRVGAPAAPVLFITDEDIVISAPQELDPFPGLSASANAIAADYPEPANLWTARAAPPLFNPAWEAEDGGRRLSISLGFPACPDLSQVAQLMAGYSRDARRFRTHRLVLPPEAFVLEPLDTIAWTSARNGYAAKIFEVVEITDQPGTVNQELTLRERDPADYAWSAAEDLPAPPEAGGLAPRPGQIIEGWSVSATTIRDGLGLERRPAIRLSWTGTAARDATLVGYEIRLAATAEVVVAGVVDRAAGAALVSEALLSATAYQARGRYLAERPTAWSSWLDATTPEVWLDESAFENGVRGLFADAGLSAPEIVATLPASGTFQGQLAFSRADNRLWRWTGTPWTAEVPAVAVTGQLSDDQIAAIPAAKLTGQITTPQIGDGAISAGKIAAGAVETAKIAAGAVTADTIAANAITSPKIVAGTITGDRLAANTITGDRIAANTITGGLIAASGIITSAAQIGDALITTAKIGNLAVSTAKIADNAVTFPSFIEGPVTTINRVGGGETTLASLTIVQSGAPVWVMAEANVTHLTGGLILSNRYVRMNMRIKADGVMIDGVSGPMVSGLNVSAFVQDTTHSASGSVTYSFTCEPTTGDADQVHIVGASLFIIELKR